MLHGNGSSAYVDKLVLGGPNALATCKELIRRVPTMPHDEAVAWTAELSASLFASEEAAAGIDAFRGERPPHGYRTDRF